MFQAILPICGLLLWLLPASIAAHPLVLTDTQDLVPATPYVSMLEDPSQQLSIEQVISTEYAQQFHTNTTQYLNLGRSQSTWWLRLDIQQHSNNHWYLLSNFPGIAQADAFIVPHGTQSIQALGSMLKPLEWQRLPMVKLPSPPSNFSIYIRMSNLGKGILLIPLELLSADALYKKTAKDTLLYGSTVIGLVILALYNLFLLISLRDWNYLTLIIFLLSLALVLQRISNVIPVLSSLSDPSTTYYAINFQIVTISGTHFSRQLMESKTLFPKTDRVVDIILISAMGITPFIGLLPYTDLWSFVLSIAMILLVSTIGFLSFRQGSRIMRSFALAFLVFLASAAPITLWGIGLLADHDATVFFDLFHLGSLLTAILLSLTLAEHTRQFRLQAERAKAENHAKDTFLMTMSHELRTPMNSVVAATNLLQQSPNLPASEQLYVTHMATASQHMLRLIDTILDLSRLKQNAVTPRNEPFHLQTVLDNLQQMLEVQATTKNLSLHIHRPSKQALYLRGDPQYLSQVLVNLLGNAIKFTEQGGVELFVREGAECRTDHICLYFEVSDTGIGIPLQDQQRLFSPFTQLENQRTRHHEGSGLGLAISHQLVELMGGKLELESSPHHGSCFFFTLEFPLAMEKTPPSLPLSGEEPRGMSSHILLVDDDPLNRFFGQELLQKLGINAATADSGAEAIQQLQQHTFDLVLMDVSMPGMDGYETTKKIRADPRFGQLPIIALTAHAIAGEHERCLAAGMNDYLTKPIDLEQIRNKISQWTASTP